MSFQCELQTHQCARLGLYALQGELYTQGSCFVQQKGKEALGLNKDRESNNDLNFGYTWLKTLKEIYGWQRRMTHGEAGAADQVGIESAQRVLAQYDADETAFM